MQRILRMEQRRGISRDAVTSHVSNEASEMLRLCSMRRTRCMTTTSSPNYLKPLLAFANAKARAASRGRAF